MKVNIKEKARTPADIKHDERLLRRIQTLVDVVYALILFELFLLFPKPDIQALGEMTLAEIFKGQGPAFATVIIGVIWVIIYWGQSNTQFGYLRRINKNIAAAAIIQVFLLMLYLYFIALDNRTEGDVFALFGQSLCLAFAGFLGAFIWRYSAVNQMHFDELTEGQQYNLYFKFMPEPVAALITMPFAFLGVGWYTLAWLSVIPLGILFNRIAKRYGSK